MRKLTFESYLKQYLLDISGQKSVSIHKLAVLSKKNIRITSPLILHCLFQDKMHILFKYLSNDICHKIKCLTKENYLSDEYSDFDFQKIYQSYNRRVNTVSYDNQIKDMIRKNILLVMNEKRISKYRIYKDLHANAGNVNDYLTNGNSSKVSLDLAKRIYGYCLAY